jgi:hypothetical protein
MIINIYRFRCLLYRKVFYSSVNRIDLRHNLYETLVDSLIAAILTKTFNREDINNLREMFSALGPLRRLFNIILNIIEKLMTILRVNNKQGKLHTKVKKN